MRREMQHKEENFLILEVFEKVVEHCQIVSLMYLFYQNCGVLRRKWRNKILNIHASLDQIFKHHHILTSFVYWSWTWWIITHFEVDKFWWTIVLVLTSSLHTGSTKSDSVLNNCKGVFTWHQGNFRPGASSLWFPLMALYLFTWYHHKMLCQCGSSQREFTPVLTPGREFHSSMKSRNGIM